MSKFVCMEWLGIVWIKVGLCNMFKYMWVIDDIPIIMIVYVAYMFRLFSAISVVSNFSCSRYVMYLYPMLFMFDWDN